MDNYFDHYVAKPKAIGDLPHHQMEKAKSAFTALVYMDNSLVSDADVVINIAEMDLKEPLQAYVDQHTHEVSSSYAIVGELVIEVSLESETQEIQGPAGVFIPAGVAHSVRPLRGKGTLVVIQRSGKFE